MLSESQYNDLTTLLGKHFNAAPVAVGPLFTKRQGTCRLRERLYVPRDCVSFDVCKDYTYDIPIRYEVEEEVPKLDKFGMQETDAYGNPQTEIVKKIKQVKHTITTYDHFQDAELGLCVGFLPRDINKLIKHFGHLDIRDERARVPLGIPYKFTGKLFKRQIDAIKSFFDPNISGILKCPPGWGKTVWMLKYIAAQQMKTLVIIHDTSLVDQFLASARNPKFTNLSQLEAEAGTKFAGNLKYNRQTGEVKDYPFTFMTYHLIIHNPELIRIIRDRYGLVLIDECHHAAAANMDNILRNMNPFYMVGVTATKHRKDGFDVMFEDTMGPVRYIGKVNSNCLVTFLRGTGVSNQMSNMVNIKKRLGADDVRNGIITARVNKKVKAGSRCGIVIHFVTQGKALVKMFEQRYPGIRVGFYTASTHRPKVLTDMKERMNAPIAIKDLVKAESDCMANATPFQWQLYDESLDPDEIVDILEKVGCPRLLLEKCRAMAERAIDVFISTRNKFAEGLDMPMLDNIGVVMPTAAPATRKLEDGEEDNEGGVAQQMAGRTQRAVYLSDGTINFNKPPSTMDYYVDDGPDILKGCARSFERACKRVGYRIVHEMDNVRRDSRKAMNAAGAME